MADKPFNYGGQAIIEGVMIRGRKNIAIAVRRPDGGVAIHTESLPKICTSIFRKIPFIRGILVLGESLTLGMQALLYSANVALEEEGQELKAANVWPMIIGALVMVIALFFLTPLLIANIVDEQVNSVVLTHVVEGGVRLGFLVLYIVAIGFIPDIRRVFSYHGAEHKAVNAHEAGVTLDVDALKAHSTAHMRCGTSFLLIVVVLAIFVFGILGQPSLELRIVSRIVLIPVIAAIGYEIIRFGGAHSDNRLVRWLLSPGLLLQSLTTREPDEQQMEVAICALREAVRLDQDDEKETACTTP